MDNVNRKYSDSGILLQGTVNYMEYFCHPPDNKSEPGKMSSD